jgi:APA family basic amino acid/polyamine antiporter
MIPVAGSAYSYAYAGLGEIWAWLIGWDLILEYGLAVACVAVGWSGFVMFFLVFFSSVMGSWPKNEHVGSYMEFDLCVPDILSIFFTTWASISLYLWLGRLVR